MATYEIDKCNWYLYTDDGIVGKYVKTAIKGVYQMAFEVYKPRGDRAEKKAVVSLSKTSIVLNNVAREKINSSRVELAFDRESNVMRIKGVATGGMEIKKTKLFGKGFFNQFGLLKRGKFEAEYNQAENALFVHI